MSKKEFANSSVQALKAVEHDEAVFLPPALRGNKNIVYAFDKKSVPSIKENTVRIAQEADPIGLIIAIAIGQPVPTYTVGKDGKVSVKHETLPLSSPVRERMIKYLADRLMPRLSVKASQQGGVDPSKSVDGAATEWEAVLGAAAEQSDENE